MDIAHETRSLPRGQNTTYADNETSDKSDDEILSFLSSTNNIKSVKVTTVTVV